MLKLWLVFFFLLYSYAGGVTTMMLWGNKYWNRYFIFFVCWFYLEQWMQRAEMWSSGHWSENWLCSDLLAELPLKNLMFKVAELQTDLRYITSALRHCPHLTSIHIAGLRLPTGSSRNLLLSTLSGDGSFLIYLSYLWCFLKKEGGVIKMEIVKNILHFSEKLKSTEAFSVPEPQTR